MIGYYPKGSHNVVKKVTVSIVELAICSATTNAHVKLTADHSGIK
jgi:hypothetical protein